MDGLDSTIYANTRNRLKQILTGIELSNSKDLVKVFQGSYSLLDKRKTENPKNTYRIAFQYTKTPLFYYYVYDTYIYSYVI